MSDFEATAFAESVRREPPRAPQGWEPGVAWDGRRGTAALATDGDPDWSEVLIRANLDPATIEVVPGTIQVRTWDAAIGNGEVRTFRYYKAEVRAKQPTDLDVVAQIAELARKRPTRKPHGRGDRAPETGANMPIAKDPAGNTHDRAYSSTFVVVAADWQIGREGTDATVTRWGDGLDAVRARYRELRKIGRRIPELRVLSVGDLVEGCKGWYPMQTFTVVLNKREQVRLARRMFLAGVTDWAPDFDRVVAGGIGGNHGENRDESGKAYTDLSDNADVEVLEQAAEVAQATPAFQHVSWAIPNRDLTLTLDIGGRIVALAHGHQAKRGGGTAQAKLRRWWEAQMFGGRPAGDAEILLTGHYHHFSHIRDGVRTHIQAPSLASGAQWFAESAGTPETPGILTFVIDANGLRDVEVL